MKNRSMQICFRDDIGLLTVNIDMDKTTGVGFDGQYAYFTDTDGTDYKISTKDIVLIGTCEEGW